MTREERLAILGPATAAMARREAAEQAPPDQQLVRYLQQLFNDPTGYTDGVIPAPAFPAVEQTAA